MDITTVVLEGNPVTKLGLEETMMFNEATRLGLKTVIVSEKQLSRNKFRMEPDMMAVGGVPFVKQALRQLGKKLPEHKPYPLALEYMLYRDILRLMRLRDAKDMLAQGHRLFVKPAGWKRFTGFVAEFPDDHRFNGASNSIPVWISTPVTFLSEWRVYVADDVILDVRFVDHGGDRRITPNMAMITGAVEELARTGIAPRGYVIDFGVLDNSPTNCGGVTALIEMNDGFSFGAYDGLQSETLWVVTLNRWMELVQ